MKRRLAELDGLRGVAVMLVVFGHSRGTLQGGFSGWLSPLSLLCSGKMGVRIFFILSGFLITSILIREYDWSGKICLFDFYMRRILRIFPAFYTYLLVVIALKCIGVLHVTATSLTFAGLHLLNYMVAISLWAGAGNTATADPGLPVVGHFWSLSMEEQFYWLWPLLLIVLLRKKTFILVPILICLIPFIRTINYILSPGTRDNLGQMLHSGSDVLLFGCLLAIGMIRYPDWVKKLILPTWAATCLILFTFILVWVPDIPPISSYPKIWADANYTIEPLIWTIIIANILLQPEAWYTRFLKTPVLVFLGTISYSLYLWQQLFCYAGINTTFTGEFPINIFCSIGLAWLSYKFIERPFLLLKSKNYSHTVQEKATAPSPTSPARRESMPST